MHILTILYFDDSLLIKLIIHLDKGDASVIYEKETEESEKLWHYQN